MSKIRRRIGHYIKTEDGKLDIAVHKNDFNTECYEELDRYIRVIFKIQPILISYESLIISHNELIQTIEKYKEQFLKGGVPNSFYMDFVVSYLVESVQKATNFLSSATSFLSTSQVKLRRDFGERSREYIEWNTCRNTLRKNSFSYRLLYELRNYSQHSNIPISTAHIRLENMAVGTPAASAILYLSKKELLNSGYNWKSLGKEIQCLEDKINIIPFIEEYLSIVKILTYEYLCVYKNEILDCHQYMHALKRVLSFPENSVSVIFIGETLPGQPVPNKIEYIPFNQFKWVFNRYSELKRHKEKAASFI